MFKEMNLFMEKVIRTPSSPNYAVKNPIFTSSVFRKNGDLKGYFAYLYKGTRIPTRLNEDEVSSLARNLVKSGLHSSRWHAKKQIVIEHCQNS